MAAPGTDPTSYGVGLIEPDNHSDDSTVEDVCSPARSVALDRK